MRFPLFVAAALYLLGPADAASLRVAPVMIDLTAPASAATLTVRNESGAPITVQTRVFRWTQTNGTERLEPTRDVVVSPPMTSLRPGVDNVVRVVRTTKQPVAGQESYRVVIDELPDARQRRPGTITLLTRHSIPAFFSSPETEPARVTWAASRNAGRLRLTAKNTGGSRMRVSGLRVAAPSGDTVFQSPGLVGYVLGGSTMSWDLPAHAGSSGTLNITAATEDGAVRAKAAPADR